MPEQFNQPAAAVVQLPQVADNHVVDFALTKHASVSTGDLLGHSQIDQSMNLWNHNSSISSDHKRCSWFVLWLTCESISARTFAESNKPRICALSESRVSRK